MTKAESRQRWSAETTDGEAIARARGRRRFNVLQRDRARLRQARVQRRLYELREAAHARGSIEWIPKGAVAQLSEEFGCSHQTISQDIRTIERQELRQIQLAPRVPQIREEFGLRRWHRLPKAIVWQWACEFNVTPWTIRRDIEHLDRTIPYRPPSPMRGVWDMWAHVRPRRPTDLPCRVGVRVAQATHDWYMGQPDPSEEIRRALEKHRGETQGYHTLNDCAFRVAQACPWEVHGALVRTAARLTRPLIDVVTSTLHVALKKEG